MNKKSIYLVASGLAVGYALGKYGKKLVEEVKNKVDSEAFEGVLRDLGPERESSRTRTSSRKKSGIFECEGLKFTKVFNDEKDKNIPD